MNARILVVDDQVEIVRVVRGYLEQAGFSVLTAYDGREGLRVARQEKPDLIVLDLMLPEVTGLDVCRTLRRESDVPIIMLTARVEETDRIIGLELGADDYVTKPFSPRELVARIRAVLRRTRQELGDWEDERLVIGELTLDVAKHSVTVGGETVSLTPSEFDILRVLMEGAGRVFSRAQLLEETQGAVVYEAYERTIDTHVKNLRKKIEPKPSDPCYILTVRGVGYKMRGD